MSALGIDSDVDATIEAKATTIADTTETAADAAERVLALLAAKSCDGKKPS